MSETPVRASVATLMQRLRPFVERRVRSRADVDDVLQDTFLKLQAGLPNLRDDERMGPWMFRVVRNAITDRYRKQARDVVAQATDDASAMAAPPDGSAPDVDLAGCIAPFVARLPQPYREAVTLVDMDGLTHAEAANRLGLSVPGVKSRVQRGRAKMREMLDACCRVELDVRHRVVAAEHRGGGCGCK